MSVGSRIKELRENEGLSRNELAELLNVTVGAISNYENEVSSPKEPILFKIMDVLNCDANYLFQDAVKMQSMKNSVSIDEMKHIEKYRSLDPIGKETVTYILDKEAARAKALAEQLKRIEELEARTEESEENGATIIDIHPHLDAKRRLLGYYHSVSAGDGVFMMGDEGVENVRIPANIPGANIADYLVKISGNSMEPDYFDGDVALVARLEPVRLGDVGIFIVDGNAYIKEYGKTELISRNPDADNIRISEHANIVCMGKVVGKIREKDMVKTLD
jgi:repressor LexA